MSVNISAPLMEEARKYEIVYRDGRKAEGSGAVMTELRMSVCVFQNEELTDCDVLPEDRSDPFRTQEESCGSVRQNRGKKVFDLVCTPQYLKELVTGRLLTEGIIAGRQDILHIDIHPADIPSADEGNKVSAEPQADGPLKAEVFLAAGCSGAAGGDMTLRPCRAETETFAGWKAEWIFAMADRFREGMPLHRASRAAHSCFLFKEDQLLFQCEDIGRHNSMDKAVGFAAVQGIDLSQCAVYTSGRIPADMAMKAVRSGIPVLAGKSVPTEQAIRLAEEYGLTLIGAAGNDSFKVFYSPQAPGSGSW